MFSVQYKISVHGFDEKNLNVKLKIVKHVNNRYYSKFLKSKFYQIPTASI